MSEVKLTKEQVQENLIELLQPVEYWQDVVDNWPRDAKYLVFKSNEENDDE